MARKNPLTKLTTAALKTIKHPVGSAEKVVDQAKGTVGLGKVVAEQVTRTAGSRVAKAAGAVTSLVPGGRSASRGATARGPETTSSEPRDAAPAPSTPTKAPRPVKAQADVVEPLVRKQAAARVEVPTTREPEPVTDIDKGAADLEVDVTPADIAKVVAKKAPAKKSAAKKSPGAKKAAKKAPTKAPATKTAENTPGAKLPPPRRPAPEEQATPPVATEPAERS